MIPTPLKGLYGHVETLQAEPDPAERLRGLNALESGLRDLLGRVSTYANDARLQIEGEQAEPGDTESA